jgi:hypothetical protein
MTASKRKTAARKHQASLPPSIWGSGDSRDAALPSLAMPSEVGGCLVEESISLQEACISRRCVGSTGPACKRLSRLYRRHDRSDVKGTGLICIDCSPASLLMCGKLIRPLRESPELAAQSRVLQLSFPLWSQNCIVTSGFLSPLSGSLSHVVPREIECVKRKTHVKSGVWLVQPVRIQQVLLR